MLRIIVSLMVGGLIGFMTAALCVAAKDGDEQGIADNCEGDCGGCNGVCCLACFVASECTKESKCKSNPGECKKTIKLRRGLQ